MQGDGVMVTRNSMLENKKQKMLASIKAKNQIMRNNRDLKHLASIQNFNESQGNQP